MGDYLSDLWGYILVYLFQDSLDVSDSSVQAVIKSVQALTSVYQMYKSLQVGLRN